MSTPAPRPAPQEAVLRQAASLGRRHGKAAVYWQIGDSGSDAAQGFYRDLLRGIAVADPEIMSLYQVPGLTAQHDYDRDNLAADLGLARDDPALGTVAVRDLAVAAVIRPCRDGWLIFMAGQGHAWYGTAEAAADALLVGEHHGGIPARLS